MQKNYLQQCFIVSKVLIALLLPYIQNDIVADTALTSIQISKIKINSS